MFTKESGGANVTTLLERRSRFLLLLANPDRRPAGVAARIGALMPPEALLRIYKASDHDAVVVLLAIALRFTRMQFILLRPIKEEG